MASDVLSKDAWELDFTTVLYIADPEPCRAAAKRLAAHDAALRERIAKLEVQASSAWIALIAAKNAS